MAAALLLGQNTVSVNAEVPETDKAAVQQTENTRQDTQEIPDADIFDVDFINGTDDQLSVFAGKI